TAMLHSFPKAGNPAEIVGRAISPWTRFPAGPAASKGGLQPRLAAPRFFPMFSRRKTLGGIYSLRRATTGSTREARLGGTKHAKAATPKRITDTTAAVGT